MLAPKLVDSWSASSTNVTTVNATLAIWIILTQAFSNLLWEMAVAAAESLRRDNYQWRCCLFPDNLLGGG